MCLASHWLLEPASLLPTPLMLCAQEKALLVKMRTELEKAANRLEQERIAAERRQASDGSRGAVPDSVVEGVQCFATNGEHSPPSLYIFNSR